MEIRGKKFCQLNFTWFSFHQTGQLAVFILCIMGNEVLQIPVQMFYPPWSWLNPKRVEDSSHFWVFCILLNYWLSLYTLLHHVFICLYYWMLPGIRTNISSTSVYPGTAKCQAHSKQSINNIELNFLR